MASQLSKEVLDTFDKFKTELSKGGKFEELELEAREQEVYEQTGGKLIKRLMAGDDKMAADVTFLIDHNNEAVCVINYPVTRPLPKEVASKYGASLLQLAATLAPANLNLSEYRRLTLTYHHRATAKDFDQLAARVRWSLTEGSNVANSLRSEVKKTNEVQAFAAKDDKIWQSQMGKPVKLSPEELAIVQAAHSGATAMAVEWVAVGVYVAVAGLVVGAGYVYNRVVEDPPPAPAPQQRLTSIAGDFGGGGNLA